MTKKKETVTKAKNEVAKAKTANDLNKLIAKHLDVLDRTKVTDADIKLASMVSGLIGRQVSVENARISFERLALVTDKKFAFVA